MSEEVNMNEDTREELAVVENIDCSNVFNTSQVFPTREDVLQWVRTVAYDIGFVTVIMRFDISTGKRERTSFVLIGCERSEKYRVYKKNLVPTVTSTKKRGCPFKLRAKSIPGGEEWMVNLICETHNHALAKLLSGHPYVSPPTEDEKIIFGDMTKPMIAAELKQVNYASIDSSHRGCIMRITHGCPMCM
ncbi:uncharacterized protein LOC114420394 [Glycine soja]|uniref:uncharacterized protein LOC114420394 n=1 Tax=Glycine soja TaxID=3848 RepID=UPI00103F66D1|nr:uncharacterized protein LOC114420394 [Glycine soja]